MVFVLKKKENGHIYYYLAHNSRVSKNKWKSYRKYLGKKLPNKKDLQMLTEDFTREFNIPIEEKFKYLDEEKLEKVDFIVAEFQEKVKKYPKIALEKIERDFTIKFTYNSNAIEGNTISQIETTALLDKKITPKGKSLREIHEITNTEKALNYIRKFKGDLSKKFVCNLHRMLMKNIDDQEAGKIRTYGVVIQGANWFPVQGKEVKKAFNEFIAWYKKHEKKLHPIELAAITHLKFIEVHPFGDGNGRLARLITNLILMKNAYPPLNIKVKDTIEYIKVLQYTQNNQKFKELVDFFLQKLGENYVNSLKQENPSKKKN